MEEDTCCAAAALAAFGYDPLDRIGSTVTVETATGVRDGLSTRTGEHLDRYVQVQRLITHLTAAAARARVHR